MLGSPGTGLPLLYSPSCLMHEPAGETAEAGERVRGRAKEREWTEGAANPWHCSSTLSYSNKPNTPVYRKGGNCISVSKGIPLNISHAHIHTHKHAVRHFPPRASSPPLPQKNRLTQTCTQGSFRGITVCWRQQLNPHAKGIKHQKLERTSVWGEVLTVDSYQRTETMQKSDDQRSDFTGKCCAAHTCQSSNWSRHLISGLISFRASHLISGRRCPSLYSQELISLSPPPSLCCCVMESLWQAVLQACMHWLYDTLHSGVLLKFPSSLPFCSAGRIMSNKKRSKRVETRQEPSLSQKRQLSRQNLMKIHPCYPPWHRESCTNTSWVAHNCI